MDVARFGEFATPEWGAVKSSENYKRRFVMSFPNETLPKGWLQKTTALHDRLSAQGALMDQGFCLEHALGCRRPYGEDWGGTQPQLFRA